MGQIAQDAKVMKAGIKNIVAWVPVSSRAK
jgi:hypothetical protein